MLGAGEEAVKLYLFANQYVFMVTMVCRCMSSPQVTIAQFAKILVRN
jgi:hypothetical protein